MNFEDLGGASNRDVPQQLFLTVGQGAGQEATQHQSIQPVGGAYLTGLGSGAGEATHSPSITILGQARVAAGAPLSTFNLQTPGVFTAAAAAAAGHTVNHHNTMLGSDAQNPDNVCGTESTVMGSITKEVGKSVCTFFVRTGTCAYGDRCKFLHPSNTQPPPLNTRGLPLRPNEVDCAHYMKKGWCAFGLTCKFNHPELGQVLSSYPLTANLGQNTFINIPAAAPAAYTTGGAGTLTYSMPSAALPTVYYVPASGQPSSQLGPFGHTMGFAGTVPGGPAPAVAMQQAFSGVAPVLAASAQHSSNVYTLRQAQLAPGNYGNILTVPSVVPEQAGVVKSDQLARAMQGLRLRDGRGK